MARVLGGIQSYMLSYETPRAKSNKMNNKIFYTGLD